MSNLGVDRVARAVRAEIHVRTVEILSYFDPEGILLFALYTSVRPSVAHCSRPRFASWFS